MEVMIGFLLSLVVLFTIYWYVSWPSNLPPGPLGLPIVGSLLDTWNGATCYPKLAEWTKKYGSIYKMYIGNQLVVVLGDFEAIQEALVKEGDAFAGKPDFHGVQSKSVRRLGLGNAEGELWRVQRRFAVRTLRELGCDRAALESRINDEAEVLLEAIGEHKGASFDITQLLYNAAANVISALMFGKRFDYDDRQFEQLLAILQTRPSELKISYFAILALSQTVAKLVRFIPMVNSIRASGLSGVAFFRQQVPRALEGFHVETDEPSNYVQAFHKARYETGGWTFFEEQLLASINNLFAAGTGPVASTLRLAIFYMCHFPHVQETVREEIVREVGASVSSLTNADRSRLPYKEAVLKEVQRVGNLIPSVLRRTVAPCQLSGYDIPEDTVVAPLIGDVLYDPRVYTNPETFDPTRFLQRATSVVKNGKEMERLVPFSIGKRSCVGEALVRTELFTFFVALMSKYKFYFSPDEPKPPLLIKSSLFRAPAAFMLCAELRGDD